MVFKVCHIETDFLDNEFFENIMSSDPNSFDKQINKNVTDYYAKKEELQKQNVNKFMNWFNTELSTPESQVRKDIENASKNGKCGICLEGDFKDIDYQHCYLFNKQNNHKGFKFNCDNFTDCGISLTWCKGERISCDRPWYY